MTEETVPTPIAEEAPPPAQPVPRTPLLHRPLHVRAGLRRMAFGLRSLPAPRLTVALLAAIFLLAIAQLAASGFRFRLGDLGNAPADWLLGAKVPSLVAEGELWRLVTASFLHGSWLHLAMNVTALLFLGALIEAYYGQPRTLFLYTVACVAGTAASFFYTPNVSLGASTGIMGLLGALLVHNYRYRRYLPAHLNAVYPLLVGILFVQLTLDLFSTGVDLPGHVGGLLGGSAAALLVRGVRLRVPGDRDLLPMPAATALAAALLLYGAGGLAHSLSRNALLLQAARAPRLTGQAAALQQVVARRPRFLEARDYLANVLFDTGDAEGAVRVLETVIEDAPPGLWQPWGRSLRRRLGMLALRRAELMYETRRHEEALRSYRHAIRLCTARDDLARAHNGYAWTLVERLNTRLDEAEQHALEAVRLDPKSGTILDTLAWVHYKQGRLEEALREQSRALQLLEREPYRGPEARGELYYHLGAIQEKRGAIRDAVTSYQRAVGAWPEQAGALEALRRLNAPSGSAPSGSAPSGAAPPVAAPRNAAPAAPRRDPAATRGIL